MWRSQRFSSNSTSTSSKLWRPLGLRDAGLTQVCNGYYNWELILENIICNNSITFLADLGELVQDSEFLNSLQNGVNRWVEAIRKVTRIDRDPSSGTALQEATFWMNFERALG